VLLAAVVLAGCTFDVGLPPAPDAAADAPSKDGGQGDAGADGLRDAARDGPATLDAPPADVAPGDGPGDGPAGDGAPVPARSCRDLKDREPAAADGVEVRVHCEMGLDSGGWTLVGRAVGPASSVPFGWALPAGQVDNDGVPYSLGSLSLSIPFTEVLFARYTNGKKIGHHAFKVTVPVDFTTNCRTVGCDIVGTPTAVLGNCDPTNGPTMLTHLGYLAHTNSFWARDKVEGPGADLHWGLYTDVFRLNGTDCQGTGQLGSQPGMVFVR